MRSGKYDAYGRIFSRLERSPESPRTCLAVNCRDEKTNTPIRPQCRRPSPTLRHTFHAGRKSRDFARSRILMKHATRHSAHNLWLRSFQRNGGGLLVARGDSFLNLAHIGADTRLARFVDLGPPRNLAHHLLGGFRIGHWVLPASFAPVRTRSGAQGSGVLTASLRAVNSAAARFDRTPFQPMITSSKTSADACLPRRPCLPSGRWSR